MTQPLPSTCVTHNITDAHDKDGAIETERLHLAIRISTYLFWGYSAALTLPKQANTKQYSMFLLVLQYMWIEKQQRICSYIAWDAFTVADDHIIPNGNFAASLLA